MQGRTLKYICSLVVAGEINGGVQVFQTRPSLSIAGSSQATFFSFITAFKPFLALLVSLMWSNHEAINSQPHLQNIMV